MQKIEVRVAEVYFKGSLRSSKHSLKSWSRAKQLTRSDTFWLGLFIGLMLMVAATIVLMCIIKGLSADTDAHFHLVFPMLGCLTVLCALLLGWNVYGWNCIDFKQLLKFRLNFAPASKFLLRGAMMSGVFLHLGLDVLPSQ
jgi:hypothetical protein